MRPVVGGLAESELQTHPVQVVDDEVLVATRDSCIHLLLALGLLAFVHRELGGRASEQAPERLASAQMMLTRSN